jgi:hypothetical protein
LSDSTRIDAARNSRFPGRDAGRYIGELAGGDFAPAGHHQPETSMKLRIQLAERAGA